jgi:hypothetical protein
VAAGTNRQEMIRHSTASSRPRGSRQRRIIVDLAAQTHRFLTQWIEDSGLLDIRDELDLSLTYWHVMDSGRDSADLLVRLLDQFGDSLPLVVVLNEVRGGDFTITEASGALARAKELGATVITLRRLQDTTMQKIDAHRCSQGLEPDAAADF